MSRDFMHRQFAAGSCYSYILSSGQDALIIDPHISLLAEYEKYLNKNRLALKYIIDTHTHADHFSLAAVLKKKFGAPILMYQKAISEIADQRLNDNDEIQLGSKKIKVIYTPGHTDDAITIHAEGRIFTGDVLLIGSVGRTDFQNGSPESMFDTLQRLKTLPDEMLLFPGHDYHGNRSSNLAKEKQNNQFLLATDKNKFVSDMRAKKLPKPFNIDNIVRLNQKGQAASIEMVSPKQAQELVQKDSKAKLLDVRSALEFSQEHIQDSLNIPIDMLVSKIKELSQSGQNYIVLCRTGNRSPMAADMLMQSGIHGVKVMDGGMISWQKHRLPVIKGQGGISIERQVRAVAGSLVLLGLILGLTVHRGFFGISIFVACGLIFAGLTDSCMMGMLLMKLPYNQKLYKTKLGGGTCAVGG